MCLGCSRAQMTEELNAATFLQFIFCRSVGWWSTYCQLHKQLLPNGPQEEKRVSVLARHLKDIVYLKDNLYIEIMWITLSFKLSAFKWLG